MDASIISSDAEAPGFHRLFPRMGRHGDFRGVISGVSLWFLLSFYSSVGGSFQGPPAPAINPSRRPEIDDWRQGTR